MARSALDVITPEKFDRRLDELNARQRQELAAQEERLQQLEAMVARKKDFAQRLEQILAEIETG